VRCTPSSRWSRPPRTLCFLEHSSSSARDCRHVDVGGQLTGPGFSSELPSQHLHVLESCRPMILLLRELALMSVGSRTGAPTLGSGGGSTAFAVARNPAAIISFPAPATSNVACSFPRTTLTCLLHALGYETLAVATTSRLQFDVATSLCSAGSAVHCGISDCRNCVVCTSAAGAARPREFDSSHVRTSRCV